MNLSGERVLAGVLCVVLHGVAVWWLVTLRDRGETLAGTAGTDALQVIWIAPRTRPAEPEAAAPATPVRAATRARARPDAAQALQLTAPAANAPDSGVVAPAAPLDLSLAPPVIDFRRDPLARPVNPSADAAPRMALQLEDRSIAGAWHRATKRRTCADLAAALRTSPASANAILASMARTGC